MKLWVNHFSLHRVEKNDYLITAMHIYTLTKTEPLNVKTCLQLCIKKTFSLRQDLFFVLVLSLSVLIIAHFYCETHFLILAVQAIKIISRSFSLFVFRKTSNIKTNCKAVYKIFSACKFFCWRNLKTNTQFGF